MLWGSFTCGYFPHYKWLTQINSTCVCAKGMQQICHVIWPASTGEQSCFSCAKEKKKTVCGNKKMGFSYMHTTKNPHPFDLWSGLHLFSCSTCCCSGCIWSLSIIRSGETGAASNITKLEFIYPSNSTTCQRWKASDLNIEQAPQCHLVVVHKQWQT